MASLFQNFPQNLKNNKHRYFIFELFREFHGIYIGTLFGNLWVHLYPKIDHFGNSYKSFAFPKQFIPVGADCRGLCVVPLLPCAGVAGACDGCPPLAPCPLGAVAPPVVPLPSSAWEVSPKLGIFITYIVVLRIHTYCITTKYFDINLSRYTKKPCTFVFSFISMDLTLNVFYSNLPNYS